MTKTARKPFKFDIQLEKLKDLKSMRTTVNGGMMT